VGLSENEGEDCSRMKGHGSGPSRGLCDNWPKGRHSKRNVGQRSVNRGQGKVPRRARLFGVAVERGCTQTLHGQGSEGFLAGVGLECGKMTSPLPGPKTAALARGALPPRCPAPGLLLSQGGPCFR